MNTDNPFATPHAELTSSESVPVPASRQPYPFIVAQIVATLCLFGLSMGWQWFNSGAQFREQIERVMPMLISSTVGSLLIYSAAVLLLVHGQRERHGILRFRPMGALLAGYILLYLLCSLALNAGLGFLGSSYYGWALEQENRQFWVLLYTQGSGLLNMLLTCLLPLWLVLCLARSGSERIAKGLRTPVAGWQVALGIGLCFSAVLYKAASSLAVSVMMLYREGDYWQPLFQFIGCAVPFAVVMLAARARLPAQVERFAAGRVLGASLVLLTMWGACVLLCSIVLAFLVLDSGNYLNPPPIVLVPAILCLAALWPLTRWSTGWFFPARAS
ncbi:hypothetical protein [Pseudomonas sp.]|uniref:hypothetical protein n=1 Tax=Pseudomonas sp. TaxID=306 RepID=UPI0031DC01A0